MKIQSLQYEDLSTGWKLDLIEFNPQLTLLVGASGVGKTKILKAIQNLKKISQAQSLNRVKWEIDFITSNERVCKWIGEFENNLDTSNIAQIKNEKLIIDDLSIIDRNSSQIFFNNNKTVKLPQDESAIALLKEEDAIKEIYGEFKNLFGSMFYYPGDSYFTDIELDKKYQGLEEIRDSGKSIHKKLYFLYSEKNPIFDKIKESFIEIFPSIENIKLELESFQYNVFTIKIKIKELNVLHWIDEYEMSSGMLKTLMHLAELYLYPDHSVILIDEFENSLGINCIDEVVFQILASERNLQFIITSHHPYIINNIDYKYWKLVTRNGSIVKAEDAIKYGIGRSRHEAFTQLINLDVYSEGIAS